MGHSYAVPGGEWKTTKAPCSLVITSGSERLRSARDTRHDRRAFVTQLLPEPWQLGILAFHSDTGRRNAIEFAAKSHYYNPAD